MLTLIVGGFFGDEGKGKIAGYLGLKDKPKLSIRTGSINAGHTVNYQNKNWKLRIIPSAFINDTTELGLAPGALTSLEVLLNEIQQTNTYNRLYIDPHVGIITEDEIREERNDEYLMKVIGSTGQGVGYGESKRILRKLKLARDYTQLEKFLCNVPDRTIEYLQRGEKILVEGTQGHYLSLYHGEYPYVTSRNTTASGILSEVGIGPKYVDEIIIVFKSYVTRVGGGPLEGEISQEEAKRMGLVEYGTVTGRMRRVAKFNIKMAKEAIKINSATQIAITKLDALYPEAHRVKEYEKLPLEARRWLDEIQEQLKIPITLIGTGEDVMDTIDLRGETI
ncbi:adenylosuccinate synthetase [Sulfolobus sp. A20]|uniref:adenylosuccinate synthetase n=2 Tax=Sulfolobaceae TaxID=118883 RepID=UPI000845FD61|nr:adenylosuccinate synthetase [Sulfolobus sp. A20]TRM76129.1 adenylosuccinate synthetase [Sulfolobus sp. A20-N-F8]TRM78511.1 adenylosuccinate synthetase [Sulfolobus sp. B5]TRM83940.1 adenylosuccinate synthetase [Sulfolobus sp. A20-N-F6]TRM98499.1 adenylosuccinate synthetase [Sulfolobus sp. F1]AOL16122.1 adenylosuccinate synthetase [Sulfolobus sp. A20]